MALQRVSGVLVNWNTCQLLLEGLGEFLTPDGDQGPRLVVVDNASTDGSAQAVAERYPVVRLIANHANLGYGAAINQGILATQTPYVLIANADVRCRPDAVLAMVEFLDTHPTVAVVGPRLISPDGTLQLSWGREPHLLTEFVQRFWWRRLENRPGQELLRRYAAKPRRVDWVLGACFMVRREVFEAVGQMDTRYFMYFEEVDLCTRLRQAGWEIWYLSVATVVHQGQASTRQAPEAMVEAYRRSQRQYYQQYHGAWATRILWVYLWLRLGRTAQGRRVLHALRRS